MDLGPPLGVLLFLLGLRGAAAGLAEENCVNHKQLTDVYSVPGDAAMLSGKWRSSAAPHNITWYNLQTGREVRDQSGRVLVLGDTLWFLKLRPEDEGEYVCVLRTPTGCNRTTTKLVVERRPDGECGRPRKASQTLENLVNDFLYCPLQSYIIKLEAYRVPSSLKWYKGCDPILDRTGRYNYKSKKKLYIYGVETEDLGLWTCTLTFTLGGVTGSVSETINAEVSEDYDLFPQVHEPANQIIKAQKGSPFNKLCRVFVPSKNRTPSVDVSWLVGRNLIKNTRPSDRLQISDKSMKRQDVPHNGVWIERLLVLSELREEDFHINYTCQAQSFRGSAKAYFTLLPTDPNILLPTGLMFGSVTALCVMSVIIYYLFKVDMALWFRGAFPVLYTNKDLDGKLYDAYVAYPPLHAKGYCKEVEDFAVGTLPKVLEKVCGYKLFIASRDCLPGQAIMDSVEENMQASRRLLLIYTASTFISKRHTCSTSSTNNNNCISKNNNDRNDCSTGFYSSDDVYSDTRQQLECVAAMHRTLLEGSLKVILVELEEISPAQLALFPESVRHLRKKQGAVCWWTNVRQKQKGRTCVSRREDEEKAGEESLFPPLLSPSCRFWKEMRYHMPVTGKKSSHPEKTVLLNI